jgi:hypothetical protein
MNEVVVQQLMNVVLILWLLVLSHRVNRLKRTLSDMKSGEPRALLVVLA